MDNTYKTYDVPEQAKKAVLEFPLTQLTLALNKEWKLSKLLQETLTNLNSDDPQNTDLQDTNQLVLAYANFKFSGRHLSTEEFQTFTQFSEYTTIIFDLHSKK